MTGFKQAEIGTLPEDWEIKHIENIILASVGGGTPSTKVKAYWDGDIHWTTSKRLSDKLYLMDGEKRISNQALESTSTKLVPSENVIVSTRVTVGKAMVNKIDIAISQDLTGLLIDKQHYLPEFVAYQLKTEQIQSIFESQKRGATIKGITREDLGNIPLLCPPFSEQGKIVRVLWLIQSAIETQEKIIQTTTELKKALMQKLFTEGLRGKPREEDSELKWDTVKLGSLAEKGIVEFQNGFPCGQWNESGIGIPQLRPFNVTDFGKIDLTQIKSIETNKSVEKYKLKQNDIVFNNTNSEELVGKTALWQNGDGYVLSNHMTIIRIKDDNAINPTYLANYLHKKWFDGHYKMVCRRHVNQASVSIERLKDIDLPYPPTDVQNEIAKSFRVVDKKMEFANAKHQTLQVLFRSMLHHLMTGQIRVKDLRFS